MVGSYGFPMKWWTSSSWRTAVPSPFARSGGARIRVRIGLAEIRGKMPEYTFDAVDWDGITVEQTNEHAIDLAPIDSRAG